MTDSSASASAQPVSKGFFSAPTDRPLSISIAGWWLFASGILSVLGVLGATNPDVQVIWTNMGLSPAWVMSNMIISGCITAIFGYGILTGRTWGRKGYIIYGAASLILSGLLFQDLQASLVFGLPTYGVLFWVLSTPTARSFFDGEYEISSGQNESKHVLAQIRRAQKNPSDLKQIAGVCATVLAGGMLAIAVYFTGTPDLASTMSGLIILGIPSLALLALGAFLWGIKRARALIGWCLLAVGGWHLFSSFSILVLQNMSMWESLQAEMEQGPDVGPMFIVLTSLTALVLAVIGGGLLYTQHKMDSEVAERVLAKREAARSSQD